MAVPESQFVENKQSLGELKQIVESVAAFATSQGGTVRIGVKPDGTHCGVQIGRTTLEDLARDIKLNTDPPQFPSITFAGTEEAALINVQVASSPIKPVFAYGRPFTRVGRSNQRLTRTEVQRLMEATTGHTWDAMPCAGLTMDDLDRAAVDDFLRRAELAPSADMRHALHNLALMTQDGHLVNGCALLFAANPQRLYPEALTRCARFAGTTSVRFIDQATYEGTLLSQIESALKFVARNTRQALRITGKPEHDVIPEYPTDAVREAIINAVCHRSYTDPGTVQVRIYDDRLEVWNPGALPPGLTIDQLYREHASHPRNPRVAQALRRANMVEQWGGGTLRIVAACQAHGIGTPQFATEAGLFHVRFTALVGQDVGEVELTDRQRRTLAFVDEHGSISTAQAAVLLEVGRSQAKEALQGLVESRLLYRTGLGRATRYESAANRPESAGIGRNRLANRPESAGIGRNRPESAGESDAIQR